MVVIKLLVLFIGTIVIGFYSAMLFAIVARFVSDVPLEPPKNENLEDSRVGKLRNRIFSISMILGFLISGVSLYVGLFTDYSIDGLFDEFSNNWLLNIEIKVSPLMCLLSGLVAGVLWAVQWERFNATKKAYNANNLATVEQKYKDIRHERRNTLLASALVLGALLLTLFYPGETSFYLTLVLLGASTVFVSMKR
ncbi:MAG: hypothetical protein K8F26_03030 [Thiobacillus sp.]|jgi:hypothetical protein|nr:hypothetical protein [Thiobacillus sp.]